MLYTTQNHVKHDSDTKLKVKLNKISKNTKRLRKGLHTKDPMIYSRLIK